MARQHRGCASDRHARGVQGLLEGEGIPLPLYAMLGRALPLEGFWLEKTNFCGL